MIPAELLLKGYSMGIFPMAMENGEIGWFSPDPRAILPLENFRIPHGLARALKKNRFEIRFDAAFEKVMRGCAARDETWINEEIIASYCNLHRLGLAHSVEAWRAGELAGGLYGASMGGAFFGESMFHTETDASKVALWRLVERLRDRKFKLLDIQWMTPHLKKFGAIEISRSAYLELLHESIARHCEF
jgi:leucyl/phenylalanyl-tRNA--protein transferase